MEISFGLYKILFHFDEALLRNNIFCKHPLYCAIYCTILPVIAPPPPNFEVFWGVLRCFFCFVGVGFWMGRGVWKKIVLDTEKGAILHNYCAIPPSPSQPPLLPTTLRNIFSLATPFIAIKYWQYLVRAKISLAWGVLSLCASQPGCSPLRSISTTRG